MKVRKYTVGRFTHEGERLCTYTAHEYYTQKTKGLQLVIKVKKVLTLYTFNDNVSYDNESNTVLKIERVHNNFKTLSNNDLNNHKGIQLNLLDITNDGSFEKYFCVGQEKNSDTLISYISNGNHDLKVPNNKYIMNVIFATMDIMWSNVLNFDESQYISKDIHDKICDNYSKFIYFKNYLIRNTNSDVFKEILDIVDKKIEAINNNDYELAAKYRQQELDLRNKIWNI